MTVVNLNKFRKRRKKLEEERRAETNRRLHGRTKAERARDELQKRQLTRQVDGALLASPARVTSEGDGDGAEDDGVVPLRPKP